MDEHPTPTVRCRDLGKVYELGALKVQALAAVDLVVPKGDFLCLSGPSGSGKSTLLNLLGGLDRPTQGEVHFEVTALAGLSARQLAELRLHRIGFVFQAYNLVPVLSARENVELVMQMQGRPAAECRETAQAVLREVGLEGLEDRRPGELSGGQQQRVAVARAVASRPGLVLADEPTANLDSTTAAKLMDLLRRMNEEHGVTFIFSTHDRLVMDYSKRLVSLHDGRIASDERRA